MNARVEMFPGQFAEAEKRAQVERIQSEIVRAQCNEVIQICADAMCRPALSRSGLERAISNLAKAHAAAAVIDPEDE